MVETEAFHDSALFAMRNYFVIENKRGDFVKLDPWAGQLMLHVAIESQRKLGLRQSIVEIKPRQIGWTSYLLGRALWKTMKPNMKASIMVIEEKVADELSKKLATMYNQLPNHLRPMKRIDNLKFVVFDNPNGMDRQANPGLNSSIFIGVPSAQRGRTPHYVVASEYAFWEPAKQDDFMTGLVGAMPLDDSACVIIDTTPNGHDEGYEPMAMDAIERNPKWVKRWESKQELTKQTILDGALGAPDRPDEGFIPVFWPWFKHETYCQVAGTLVSTLDGVKPIEAVAVGQATERGKVVATYKFENRRVVKVTTESGRTSICTPNHPFLVGDTWVEAQNVLGREVTLEAPGFGHRPLDPMAARLLGFLGGDGYFEPSKGNLSLGTDSKDQDAVGAMYECVAWLCEKFPSSKGGGPGVAHHNGASYVRSARKAYIEFLDSLGALGLDKKRLLRVPRSIWESNKSAAVEYLRALYESDGHYSNQGNVSFASKYYDFVADVQILLQCFGIQSRIYQYSSGSWCLYCRVSDSEKFMNEIGFISARKSARRYRHKGSTASHGRPKSWMRKPNKMTETVTSVEEYGTADVYDITVEGTHSFVANGLVVHNTTKDEHPLAELPKLRKAQYDEVKETLGKLSQYGNDEEEFLHKTYGIGIPRLYWRRRKIDSYFTSSRINDERLRILVFQQEYATTWRDCFVDYNQSPFDNLALDYIGRHHVKMPAAVGLLRSEGVHGRVVLDTTWKSDYEALRVYAPPDSADKYVMGVDTQIAFDSDESDYTVAQVVRVRDRKIVATYQAKVPVYRLRDQLHLIYEWYNRPYYAVESEGIGYGLIRELIDLGMSNTYYWKRLDAVLPEDSKYPGWETNHKTRPIMEQALIECLAHRDPDGRPDPLVIITDLETYKEIQSLKRDSTGKIAAGSRAHDDHAMALMICLAIMNETSFPYALDLPEYKRDKKREQKREVNALLKRWGSFGESNDRNNPDLATL